MFEGDYSPPTYGDRYNFLDGAQDDIFEDSYDNLPDPSPTSALPILSNITDQLTATLSNLPSLLDLTDSLSRRNIDNSTEYRALITRCVSLKCFSLHADSKC